MNDTHIYAPRPNAETLAEYSARMQAQENEKLERAQARAVSIPAGEIDTPMLAKIARENTGMAFNTLIELAESEDTPAAVRKQAADAIIERGHGKVQPDQPASAAITIVINKFNNTEPETITINGNNPPPQLEA